LQTTTALQQELNIRELQQSIWGGKKKGVKKSDTRKWNSHWERTCPKKEGRSGYLTNQDKSQRSSMDKTLDSKKTLFDGQNGALRPMESEKWEGKEKRTRRLHHEREKGSKLVAGGIF